MPYPAHGGGVEQIDHDSVVLLDKLLTTEDQRETIVLRCSTHALREKWIHAFP